MFEPVGNQNRLSVSRLDNIFQCIQLAVMDLADNAALIVDSAGEVVATAEGTKRVVADALWDAVLATR